MLTSLLAVVPPGAVAAGTSVVTNCEDGFGPAPAGSLRAAVEAADADGSATADDPHVVTFALDPPCGAILLAGAALTLTNHIDIRGPGANALTVSASHASQVFYVPEGVTATISGLTIADGATQAFPRRGGNIFNRGYLTLREVIVTGGFADWGGGIESGNEDNNVSNSSLTIESSTLSGNTAELGGGAIWTGSQTTIVNSTISGNTAEWGDGVQAQWGPAVVQLIGSTVSGRLIVVNTARIELLGTIVVNGLGSNCSLDASLGTFVSLGYNLDDDGSCGLDPSLGDIPNGVPGLLDLDDNGGPTPTHALSDLSDALDHIPAADCAVATDQRGFPRPSNGSCDIGAYERFIQTYFLACLYAGSLSQVTDIGDGPAPPVNCGRGEAVELLAAGDPQFGTLHACLYAGSLSQVGMEPPANCGRGTPVALAIGDTMYGCLYAGRLSQLGYAEPASCGRGAQVGLARAVN